MQFQRHLSQDLRLSHLQKQWDWIPEHYTETKPISVMVENG